MSDATTPGLEISRLGNGLTVVTEAVPHVATVTVGLFVGVGSRHERADEHGLSHLIEHMAFKGTRRRSARVIAEDIENVGGDINAATSVEDTSYTARVLGEDIGLAIDVLGDIVTDSVFDEAELARERGVILQEIAAVEDNPDDLVNDAFLEAAFPGQALGRPILGTKRTIRGFHAGAIRAFLGREYVPGRMVLSAAGAVRHDQVVDLTARAFGGLQGSDPAAPAAASYVGGERRLNRRLEQANLVLGWPGLSFKDPAYYATHMFAHVLGGGLTSRLWHEVRETRGLAYGIDAFHWPFADCGLFGIGAGTAGEDVGELVEVALASAGAASRGIEAAEVARGKAQLKVSLLTALEAPGGRVERNARQLLAWGRVIPAEEIVAKVDAVTVDEVRAAGREVLSGPPTLAAIGPIRALPPLAAIRADVSP